jgi:hypothetical protein
MPPHTIDSAHQFFQSKMGLLFLIGLQGKIDALDITEYRLMVRR